MTHRLERGNKRVRERPASRYDPYAMFNLGFGELLLILIIVAVVFGSIKLPQLGEGLANAMKRYRGSLDNREPRRLLLQRRAPRRWTLSDWSLLVAAVGLVALAIANAAMRR